MGHTSSVGHGAKESAHDESMDGRDRQHAPVCADLAALVEGHELCTDEGHQYAGQTGLMKGDAIHTYGMIVGAKRRRRLGVGANAAIDLLLISIGC